MGKYDDIINLPHHVSEIHPQMPMIDRAAQFSPFAALSGHGEAIKETERLTDAKRILDEDIISTLNTSLQKILELDHPRVSVTFFRPDGKKAGGKYITVDNNVKRIDPVSGTMIMMDGSKIVLESIVNIEIF